MVINVWAVVHRGLQLERAVEVLVAWVLLLLGNRCQDPKRRANCTLSGTLLLVRAVRLDVHLDGRHHE